MDLMFFHPLENMGFRFIAINKIKWNVCHQIFDARFNAVFERIRARVDEKIDIRIRTEITTGKRTDHTSLNIFSL